MNFRARLILALTVLSASPSLAETMSFTNAAGFTIFDSATPPTKASIYPSFINVAGLSGTISKLTVTIGGLNHLFPADIDLLLVAPDGTSAVIMSDAGAGDDLSGITITLDDDAGNAIGNSGLVPGTYRPTNIGSTLDTFPSPAPAAGMNSALSTFRGVIPTGVWSLYAVDDANLDGGSIGSWTLNISTAEPAKPGDLVISEFRWRGANGDLDEFVEIQNVTNSDHVVKSVDGSSGYAVAASDGITRFVIPNGTVIPSGGHFLGTNPVGYSVSSYPAGNGSTATGDATFSTQIQNNAGIAIFRTSNPGNFNLANRLDAVGSTAEASSLYREGTGYPQLTPFSINHSFYRDLRGDKVKDTDNNAQDFLFVDTNGTSAGAGQRLGAPGPENLSSPVRKRVGPPLVRRLLDTGVAFNASPNRVRDFTSDPVQNSTFGTYSLRRRFLNSTGAPITRLRFRVAEISTFPSPSGVADLRPRTSGDMVVPLSGGASVTVRGTTLEQPPSQPNGGGFNSTWSVNSVSTATPLAANAVVDVQFLFGIQQTGSVKLSIVPETLPASATGTWVIEGHTDSVNEREVLPDTAILSVARSSPNVHVQYRCATGVNYQLQRSTDLGAWTNQGPQISGTGAPFTYVHPSGSGPVRQFYRLMEVK